MMVADSYCLRTIVVVIAIEHFIHLVNTVAKYTRITWPTAGYIHRRQRWEACSIHKNGSKREESLFLVRERINSTLVRVIASERNLLIFILEIFNMGWVVP